MSQILKPRIPKINWRHPLTRGLVFDMPFFEGTTTPIDIVGIVKSSDHDTPQNVTTPYGHGILWRGGTTSDAVDFDCPAQPQGARTYEFIALIHNYTSQAGSPARIIDDGLTVFIAPNGSSGKLDFSINWGGTSVNFESTQVITKDIYYHYCLTYDGTVNDPVCYINGKLEPNSVPGNASGSLNSTPTTFQLGNRSDFARVFDGNIVYWRMWNRQLSANEARQLYSNPWQIYQKPGFLQPLNLIASVISVLGPGWKTLLGVGQI